MIEERFMGEWSRLVARNFNFEGVLYYGLLLDNIRSMEKRRILKGI